MIRFAIVLLFLAGCGGWAAADADGVAPASGAPGAAGCAGSAAEPGWRVASYNIRHGRGTDDRLDLDRTAAVLEALDADIIGLQEVDDGVERSGAVDQPAWLGERLGMHHAFASFFDYQGGRYGMAILSRCPFRSVRAVPLPEGNEPRVALAVELELPGGRVLTVVNVHFDWVEDDGFRFRQAGALARVLDTLRGPYLVIGDFNDQPGSRTLELFHARAEEAAKPASDPFTFPSGDPEREIDFIFAAPVNAWTIGAVEVVDEALASDHRPVTAELTLLDSAPTGGFPGGDAAAIFRPTHPDGGAAGPPPPAVAPPAGDAASTARDAISTAAPGADAGRLYHADGRPAEVAAIVEQALGTDVVFMGERHGDPAAHALQLQILEALIEASRKNGREVVLSLEMFERDVQEVLDEYLAGLIEEEHFLAAARPWPQYARDYRPLVELARENNLRVVAANAPRRYVNRVSRLGPASLFDLPESALRHLPALPYPRPSTAYRAEWDALMGQMAHGGAGPAGDNALQSQALWDASMAESIDRAIDGPLDPERARGARPLVFHIAGSFHIQNRTGTPEALRHYRPDVRDLVVTTWPVEVPSDFRAGMEGVNAEVLGDFILMTPASTP